MLTLTIHVHYTRTTHPLDPPLSSPFFFLLFLSQLCALNRSILAPCLNVMSFFVLVFTHSGNDVTHPTHRGRGGGMGYDFCTRARGDNPDFSTVRAGARSCPWILWRKLSGPARRLREMLCRPSSTTRSTRYYFFLLSFADGGSRFGYGDNRILGGGRYSMYSFETRGCPRNTLLFSTPLRQQLKPIL